jgi:outer membrane murein-binding lipoprotein Lpp
MTYIPQEAKEQIVNLMAKVDQLESDKDNTLKELDSLKKKNTSNVDKANTVKFALIAIIALLVIALVFVYAYVPGSINSEEKAANELYVSNLEKQNTEYKADIKELKSKLSAIEKSNKMPDLLYKVQIGAFKSFALDGYIQPNKSILEKDESGFKKYSLGSFTNYKDALKFKKEVKRLGFRKAFLVVEYKGQKINVKEGIKLENR